MSDWKSRAKPVSSSTNNWKSRATALPTKDYNSPEALAAEGEATKMAEIKAEHDNPLEVAVRSVTRGITGGFMDEAVGALGAIGDQIVGTPKTFGESYKENRDKERMIHKVDDINHPVATTVGRIGGGVATGGLLPGASTLTGSVGYGAVQGLGESEAETIKGMAKDAALGGTMGAAGYGVGKVIPAVAKTVAHPINAIKTLADKGGALAGAVSQGAREGAKDLPFGLSQVGGVVGGAKTLIKTYQDKAELNAVVNGLRKTFGPGGATDLSNEDVLMSKLLEPGDNVAKRWVASKYAKIHGGDSDQYLKLLNQSADDTAAARGFDRIQTSKDLVGDIEGTYSGLKSDAGRAFGDLKEAAKNSFEGTDTSPVKTISEAIKAAHSRKSISGSTRNVLDDIFYDLAGREGEKSFTQLNPAEQFERMLATKQALGKATKWASQNELPEGQQLLADTYNKFRDMTQSLESMASADKGYSGFKGLEKDLFKKFSNTERGRIAGFEPTKIEDLFSGNKTGRRLAATVQEAKAAIENGSMPKEQADRLKPLIDKFDELSQKAGTQRDLNNFRYKDAGPSSPAIQRMSAIAGKDSAATTAVKAPQMFLKMREEAAKLAKSQFGKSIDELKPSEREKVAKYALWISQNADATDTDSKRKLLELGLVNVK